MSERYARVRDYAYPLAPDSVYETRLAGDRLEIIDAHILPESGSWLLPVAIRTSWPGRWREPSVEIQSDGHSLGRQYFEPGTNGQRYLDLSDVEDWSTLKLIGHDCQLSCSGRLMGWRLPELDDGPLLILAPHPDDAEIAAYGLYRKYHQRSWIVTLTPGERLPRLDRQYLGGLDDRLEDATHRKGRLRAWNAATTPLLAGIPPERHIMLGHFNRHLSAMLAMPQRSFVHPVVANLTPGHFRQHNRLTLPTDAQPRCCGEDLLRELSWLLTHIRPTTVVLPDPSLDPHPDHVATTQALVQAISQGARAPTRLLSYANHLRGTTLYPYGPEGARTALPPARLDKEPAWGYFSLPLDREAQREKTVALMTMSDLQTPVNIERQLKRRLAGILWQRGWRDPARHAYFRTAIKHNETFRLIRDPHELNESLNPPAPDGTSRDSERTA